MSVIERIEVEAAVPPDLIRYFEEAHQSYLYGFPVACAVLCRAIVESGLKSKLPGKFAGLTDRIEEAHAAGLLSQVGRVWAYSVKELGDKAIHQYDRFAKGDLSGKVVECLDQTRMIVQELYGRSFS